MAHFEIPGSRTNLDQYISCSKIVFYIYTNFMRGRSLARFRTLPYIQVEMRRTPSKSVTRVQKVGTVRSYWEFPAAAPFSFRDSLSI